MDYKAAKDPNTLLTTLQEHERVIGQLYQAYSHRFPDHAHLWEKLAQEENKHADCLDSLRMQIQDDPDIVIMQRFSTDAIEFSIRYVKELIERSRQPDFKIINALSLAMKLEEALLENNYFEVLAGDTEDVRSVLEILTHETKRHFQTLTSAFRDCKANPV